MRYFQPKKITVEAEALQDPLAREILLRSPETPVEVIDDVDAWVRAFNRRADALTHGKKELLLKRHRGRAFKPFPEIPGYLSCHFQVLHLGTGCDLDCTYCILQAYLNNPVVTVYTNFAAILDEVGTVLDQNRREFFRITTGELIDSLSLDHLTGWSVPLVRFFAARDNAVLEFKTKSDNVARLREADPKGKVIVSWSLNSPAIQRREELKCATLEERLRAARACQEWGYLLGFHFDPLIVHDHWEEEYAQTVRALARHVDPRGIAWISLGTLRFVGELKGIAEKRFPHTPIFAGEFVRGLEGKYRYFKPVRRMIYTRMRDLIRSFFPQIPLYLCMEGEELWESGLETRLSGSLGLKGYLDSAARRLAKVSP